MIGACISTALLYILINYVCGFFGIRNSGNVDHTRVNNKLERFLPEKTPHQELVDREETTNNIYRTNKTRDTNIEITDSNANKHKYSQF